MPITPIDMLTLIPRTNEVSSIKHVEMQRPTEEQMQMNTVFQQRVKHNNKKTVETQKGENKEYRYDAKEKGNGQQFGSDNKKGKKQDSKEVTKFSNGSSFDIKI